MPMPDKALYEKLCRYCETRERCRSEVLRKCDLLKIPDAERNEYLALLEKAGFLNENRFIELFIEHRLNRSKWGLAKIRAGLAAKGIPENDFKALLDSSDPEKYFAQALEAARRKYPYLRAPTAIQLRMKLFRFLAGRGYSQDLIKRVIDEAGFDFSITTPGK